MTSLSSPSETLASVPRLTLPLCCLIIAALPLTPSTYSLFWHCHWPDRTALPSIAAWQPCSCLPDSAHSCPQCSASKTGRPPNLPTTLRRLITATYTKHTQTHICRLIPTLHRVDWWAAICTNPLFQHISNKSHSVHILLLPLLLYRWSWNRQKKDADHRRRRRLDVCSCHVGFPGLLYLLLFSLVSFSLT